MSDSVIRGIESGIGVDHAIFGCAVYSPSDDCGRTRQLVFHVRGNQQWVQVLVDALRGLRRNPDTCEEMARDLVSEFHRLLEADRG